MDKDFPSKRETPSPAHSANQMFPFFASKIENIPLSFKLSLLVTVFLSKKRVNSFAL